MTLGLSTTFGGLVTPLIGRAADAVGIASALQILWIVAIVGALFSFVLRSENHSRSENVARVTSTPAKECE